MLPGAPEPRPETTSERDRRRAAAGLDRRGLKQVAIALGLIFGSLALLVAADVAGVERRLTQATVVGLTDRLHANRTRECVTQLTTGYGEARLYTSSACRYAAWPVGDTAEVEARQLRFTRTIVLSTRGTIFAGARTVLPES